MPGYGRRRLHPETNVCLPPLDILHIRQDLVNKVHAAAAARRKGPTSAIAREPPRPSAADSRKTDSSARSIVAVGSSTGGPKALQEILPHLPADLSVPILIVQHMPPGFTAPFAQRLNNLCAVRVREAVHRDPIEPGVVYSAPISCAQPRANIRGFPLVRPSTILALIYTHTRCHFAFRLASLSSCWENERLSGRSLLELASANLVLIHFGNP